MNSQLFPTTPNPGSCQTRSCHLPLWYSTAVQWLIIFMLIATVILFPERPAWGGDIDHNFETPSIYALTMDPRIGN